MVDIKAHETFSRMASLSNIKSEKTLGYILSKEF